MEFMIEGIVGLFVGLLLLFIAVVVGGTLVGVGLVVLGTLAVAALAVLIPFLLPFVLLIALSALPIWLIARSGKSKPAAAVATAPAANGGTIILPR